MYEQVFNFSRRPFALTPISSHYCAIGSIEDSRLTCVQSVTRQTGPALVVGATGTGKSMLLARLADEFSSDYQVIQIQCSSWKHRFDLLKAILFELRLPYQDLDEGELRLSLIDSLQPGETNQQGLVLLLDDAHRLHPRVLDELLMISNIVRDGKPRAFLVMAGLSRIEETLAHPRLASMNQRIAARCSLNEWTPGELTEFLNLQCESAGRNREEIFTNDACTQIQVRSGGIPRIVNQLCDAALLRCAADSLDRVDGPLIDTVWSELNQLPIFEPAKQANDQVTLEFGSLDSSIEFESESNDHAELSSQVESSQDASIENLKSDIALVSENASNLESAAREFEVSTDSLENSFEVVSAVQNTEASTDSLPRSNDPFGAGFESEESVEDNYAAITAKMNEAANHLDPAQLDGLVDATMQISDVQSMLESTSEKLGESPTRSNELTSQESNDEQVYSADSRNGESGAKAPSLIGEPLQAQNQSPTEADDNRIENTNTTIELERVEQSTASESSESKTAPGWSETAMLQEIYRQQSALAEQLNSTMNVAVDTTQSEIDSREITRKLNEQFSLPLNTNEQESLGDSSDTANDEIEHRVEYQLENDGSDDKDMIVMSQSAELGRKSQGESSEVENVSAITPGAGRAKRVDYKTLFAHLRSKAE